MVKIHKFLVSIGIFLLAILHTVCEKLFAALADTAEAQAERLKNKLAQVDAREQEKLVALINTKRDQIAAIARRHQEAQANLALVSSSRKATINAHIDDFTDLVVKAVGKGAT